MQRDWGSSRVSCGVSVFVGSKSELKASYGDPQNVVRVNGVAGATDELLVTSRVDDDGVLRSTCVCQFVSSFVLLFCDVPRRLASRGLMSKMSMPCIFPRISRRSRPVDCSASVGTVPGLAPSGMRSSMDLISAAHQQLALHMYARDGMSSELGCKMARRTVELLEALEDAGGVGGVAGLLLVGGLGLRVACSRVNGASYDSSWGVPYGAQRWW